MNDKQTTPLSVGLLAHVDAGKTSLSEGMLYRSGTIKKIGRVDHKDAFLDTDSIERDRGITIFSKQAVLPLKHRNLVLMDTPGHMDFSSEMERTLQVLDYAILVISGTDGVQAHTETLWRLLKDHKIPTFLFINKMDLPGTNRAALMEQLRSQLDEGCVAFGSGDADTLEEIATCSEALMTEYLEQGSFTTPTVAEAIYRRQLFPCYFGSALKLEGIDAFLDALDEYTLLPRYPSEFGAQVYKISRDGQGNRLTWMKLTGGSLKPKTMLSNRKPDMEESEVWSEKADQIRIYSGEKYKTCDLAEAGSICAVTGLTRTFAGQGLGIQPDAPLPTLESVLTYQILLPEGSDPQTTFAKLKELEEEDPTLCLVWNRQLQQIRVRLMGKIQLEVLQSRIAQRFGLEVTFGPGSIVYKETIAEPVEGVGHFEPLRHYAEVHLLLEPLPQGSGIQFATACSEDTLDRNWQRLILTHLMEKEHLGVLTGAPLTDVRFILLNGRAHVKHTEGGDFREATYRAIRMGLMRGKSVLLEPWYQFRLDVPTECVGRAMADLQRMGSEFELPDSSGERSLLTGFAPVSAMADYPEEVITYTRGRGRLNLQPGGYRPCHNTAEVVESIGYQPEADLENTPDSVFCAHGGGFTVKWNEVPEHMHLPWCYRPEPEVQEKAPSIRRGGATYSGTKAQDKELEAIFVRTYGAIKPRAFTPQAELRRQEKHPILSQLAPAETYLLVDGYNIIFAWDDLKKLAQEDLDAARNQLIHMLCNYQGYKRCGVILVFDAYRIKGGTGSMEKVNNIFVVYTKHAETADTFIERTSYELGKNYRVRVATSDGMEQAIILGHNAQRVSARVFREEVDEVEKAIELRIQQNNMR